MSENTLNKPIVLVGMMGCGKSFIGKALAKDFGLPFYDSDSEIEKQQGKTITEIFKNDGEAHFRALERDTITGLLSGEPSIIATGGGALATPETLDNIKRQAVAIWLNPDIETIWQRVKNDKARPLLQCDNPKEKLAELMEARKALYEQADIQVGNLSDANDVINEIKQGLSRK